MMTKARIIAAALTNAWRRYDADMKKNQAHVTIRLAEIPAKEAYAEKVCAYISHGYVESDQHEPSLVIECERSPYQSGFDRPRIRLTEAEAVDLGRFIREYFGD